MRHLLAFTIGLMAVAIAGCSQCESKSDESAALDVKQECGSYVLVPAQYDTVTELVCVQQPSVQKQQVEAQYQTVTDTVVDTPGHWSDSATAAVYKDVSERVMVSPGRKEWRKVDCSDVELNPGEERGDAYCLFDVPPVYENRVKKVLCSDATSKRTWVAPVTRTVERRMLVTAAHEIDRPIEPKYESRTRQQLSTEARWEWRWGEKCSTDETEHAYPRASRASPPPPFEVGPVRTAGTDGY